MPCDSPRRRNSAEGLRLHRHPCLVSAKPVQQSTQLSLPTPLVWVGPSVVDLRGFCFFSRVFPRVRALEAAST